jgi:hypothetical protein
MKAGLRPQVSDEEEAEEDVIKFLVNLEIKSKYLFLRIQLVH